MGKLVNYFPANAVAVCIDTKAEVGFAGRVYGTAFAGALVFGDFAEFLLKLDELFDRQGYPQAYQVKRSFRESAGAAPGGYCYRPQQERTVEEVMREQGEIATYYLVVNTRKRSSWQGALWNREGVRVGEFSSDLELLKLFGDVLK